MNTPWASVATGLSASSVDEEGVLRVSGGMIVREVESTEVIPVRLDLGALLDREAQSAEELEHLPLDQSERV